LDAACLPALARLGMIVLPPDLRAQVERLDDTDAEWAQVVRADVERLAALLAKAG
jgi:DNA-binding GntR family transcriptional regulator